MKTIKGARKKENNLRNKVIIQGVVSYDPIAKYTRTGKITTSFTIAIYHPTNNPDKQPHVSYIEIETWEKLAEFCSREIYKKDRIEVRGYLKQDRWENSEGKIMSKIKIVGKEITKIEG